MRSTENVTSASQSIRKVVIYQLSGTPGPNASYLVTKPSLGVQPFSHRPPRRTTMTTQIPTRKSTHGRSIKLLWMTLCMPTSITLAGDIASAPLLS